MTNVGERTGDYDLGAPEFGNPITGDMNDKAYGIFHGLLNPINLEKLIIANQDNPILQTVFGTVEAVSEYAWPSKQEPTGIGFQSGARAFIGFSIWTQSFPDDSAIERIRAKCDEVRAMQKFVKEENMRSTLLKDGRDMSALAVNVSSLITEYTYHHLGGPIDYPLGGAALTRDILQTAYKV